MITFLKWLNESTANIVIRYEKLESALKSSAEKINDSIRDLHDRRRLFKPDVFFNDIQKQFANYPLLKNFLRALHSQNHNYIFDQFKKVRDWIDKQPYGEASKLRNYLQQVWTYLDYLIPDNSDAETETQKALEQTLQGSKTNMEKLKSVIQESIERIPNWNGSPVTISPYPSENEYGVLMEPAENAEIILGSGEMLPSFVIFKYEDKLEIDDVLEGGDEDFFQTPQIQMDYFNLINELRKPGSTNKGKILTLYTARPRKDRQQYLSSNKLPINIFLTNSFDHAEGIAVDLGATEIRDIWKVKIDSRYLTQTLDGPIKYYQVTVADAPAKLDLLS